MKKLTPKLMCVMLLLSLSIYNTQAQVTIGSLSLPAKGALLDLKEKEAPEGGETAEKGIILPRVELERLTSLAPMVSDGESDIALQKTIHKGMQVYNTNTNTSLGLSEGIYIWNGNAWGQVTTPPHLSDDATRFLGGTVSVKFDYTTPWSDPMGQILDSDRVIGGGSGSHAMGRLSGVENKVGGLSSLLGSGYTISHVGKGVFDIKFDVPFDNIYGITAMIADNYQKDKTILTKVIAEPGTGTPGTALDMTDNVKVNYIDNDGVRLETGGGALMGDSGARSFTFLIVGK